ncbi:ankyrin repeat and protein kinase domain-containing protein 1 [Niveomyces insectorum RCEF 264]|uniref:Ankyrin repeat and protein kinase domain-containing protein 1 n=1 Tax=Niveomyces insectorum RCEF 264 TaxID=1081102 RepID=A0A167N9A5_9HYPO|nr:ankyrin repeat and protein kinase domain-containing protein 1 [Niveomyces insectorum RCEF 264]
MSSVASSVPETRHLRLITAAALGQELRVQAILSEEQPWTLFTDRDALRQALQKAAAKGSLPVVRLLLERGAETSPRYENEIPPLFRAVEGRHLSVVQALLQGGASPDWHRPKDGVTALFIASQRGFVDIATALLAAGADPSARDHQVRTPLLFTASEKSDNWNEATLRILLDNGADIESRDHIGRTALLWAAAGGKVKLVDALLSGVLNQTADVSARNNRGSTAPFIAAQHDNEELVDLLLKNGANTHTVADGGWTVLHTAAGNGFAGVVRRLLEAGAVINARLANGMTALHWAAMNGHTDVVKLLLERPEVDLEIKDMFNRTPMLCAAEKGFIDTAFALSPSLARERRLSSAARGACRGFQATIVDFGSFRAGKKLLVSKHSVYDVLYGRDEFAAGPLVPIWPNHVKYQPTFRWIHLPANNVSWAETLFERALAERRYRDFESFKALDACFDQEQRGPLGHERSMRPFCQRVVAPRAEPAVAGKNTTSENIVLFVPFLHYETVEGREKMDNAVKHTLHGRAENTPGRYLSPDVQLVSGYLNSERPVHVRRTLDQYFYSSVDSSARDKDQVVSRYCDQRGLERRMLMVDQLWLWVLGKDLVVTCFAERWERPKRDPLNVLDNIIESVNGEQRIITTAYHLATFIVSHCCNIFDRPGVDQDYRFFDMFGSSIGVIISRQAALLRTFYQVSELSTRWLRNRQRRNDRRRPTVRRQFSQGEQDHILDALLDLGDESSMLNEINDIRDELNIIETILSSQMAVVETFESAVTEALTEELHGNAAAPPGKQPTPTDPAVGLRKRWREQKRLIETRLRDLERMDRRAENTYTSLRSLLELKQMQSNALEAKFARDQAVTASKQGQAILVFTVVTIVFLPMSFVATLFTINIDTWSDPLTLRYVAKYTFGIGLGISLPLVVMVLTVTHIVATVKGFLVGAKNCLLWCSQTFSGDDDRLNDRDGDEVAAFAFRGGGLFPENGLARSSPYYPSKNHEESTARTPAIPGEK